MEQITKEMLDRIIAAYWGCRIQVNGNQMQMIGLETKCIYLAKPAKDYAEEFDFSDCQIMLKPLSLISNEDAIEVAKMNFHGHTEHPQVELGRALVQKIHKHIYCEKVVTIIDFLRSKSYDCGYGNIPSLIAMGIAVEAK